MYETPTPDNPTTTAPGGVGFMVMQYPGRPPMVPMPPMAPPMPMGYMQLGAPPPMMPAVMPMPPHMLQAPPLPPMPAPPHMRPFRPHHHGRPNHYVNNKRQPEPPSGPPVTVFVGNITERAPDAMIRHILAACGPVISWKRVQAFGFCEFGSPDAGLRAIRLLHDFDIGDKKLVVKVDAKTKTVLDEYKGERRKKLKGSPLQDEVPDDDDYIDDAMKQSDKATVDRIYMILNDYRSDMTNFIATPDKDRTKTENKDRKISKTQEKLIKLSQAQGEPQDPPPSDSSMLDDVELEEGKRDLITREIGKFREIMKKQEEEKEEERRRKEIEDKEREEKHQARRKARGHSYSRSRSRSHSNDDSHSASPESNYSSGRSRRSKTRERRRSYSKERDREQRDRERERNERERERERERDRDREREREREEIPKKTEREILREREEEEEAKERKKMERKAREKEAAYQERLRNWEGRERRKQKDYEKEQEKERLKEEEREREAKTLKEFLEDYDDERDDPKYYKGRELQKRLAEREKEIEQDGRDRQREKEELEELRSKIFSEEHEDPCAEFEKKRLEREEQYKPLILIDVNQEHMRQKEKEKERELREREREYERDREYERNREYEREKEREREKMKPAFEEDIVRKIKVEKKGPVSPPEPLTPQDHHISHQANGSPAESDRIHSVPTPEPVPPPHIDSKSFVIPNGPEEKNVKPWHSPQAASQPAGKKKKLDVKEVFNTDDDEDNNMGASKKRKLVPLDYGEDKKKKEEKKEDVVRSQEEKRKHIKLLIDKIPTDKSALFAFPLDWAAVDNQLMERRIRPWINKKIIEYIGEPEPTLVDFICSKVLAGSSPQGILDDVQMVLDEEAEVFVVKMWRLLIYEIEAKKLGLVK